MHFAKQAAAAAHSAGLISRIEFPAARELHLRRDRAVHRWTGLSEFEAAPPQPLVAELSGKEKMLTARCVALEESNECLKEEVAEWRRC